MPVILPPLGGGATPTPTPASDRFSVRELVEETLAELSGHALNMGQVTWLVEPISDTATTFRVADANAVYRGIAEIGDELVYVATSENGTCTVTPTGRGYRASQPQSWPENTEVTFAPRFPRHVVLNRINDVITNLWPSLFAMSEVTFTFVPNQVDFEMPADAEEVTKVEFDEVGPQKSWTEISTWRFNKSTAEFTSGKSISLPELTPGRTARVRYRKRPLAVVYEDAFTDSGLQESAWPCVMYGALARLVPAIDLGRQNGESAQAAELARVRGSNAAQLGQQYYAYHLQYLEEERNRLLAQDPPAVHFTR